MGEETSMTPEKWEELVKASIMDYIESFVGIAKDCNMGTRYFHPVKEQFESHAEFDETKIDGVELRIVFNFVGPVDPEKVNFT